MYKVSISPFVSRFFLLCLLAQANNGISCTPFEQGSGVVRANSSFLAYGRAMNLRIKSRNIKIILIYRSS